MRLNAILAAGLMAVCFVGCGKPGVVGNWKGTKAVGPATATVHATFTDDKNYVLDNSITSPMGSLKTRESGTYAIKDKEITFTLKEGSVNGQVMPRRSTTTVAEQFELKDDKLIIGSQADKQIELTRVKK